MNFTYAFARRFQRRRLLPCLLLACALPAWSAPARTVRLTNGEWPPYLSATLPGYGMVSRVVSEAFAAQGIAVQFGFFPWPRALMLARIGSWDGSVAWLYSPVRERDFYYSDPVVTTETMLFHLKSTTLSWNTVNDLGKYRIGVSQDYFYGAAFAQAIAEGKISIETVARDEQNLTKLLGGRIDVFPIDRRAAAAMLRQHFSEQDAQRLSYDPRPIHSQPLHLILTRTDRRNGQLMEEFNKGLKKLKASGRLDALYKQE